MSAVPKKDLAGLKICLSKPMGICRVRGCRKRHGKKDRICPKHKMFLWRTRCPVTAEYHRIRNKAKARGIPFLVSPEAFADFCEMTKYLELKGTNREDIHIDRKRSTDPYTIENMELLTNWQNVKKQNIEIAYKRFHAGGVVLDMAGNPDWSVG
jgi:hypothetical protein